MLNVKKSLVLSLVGYLVLGNALCLHASTIKKRYAKDGRLLWEFNASDFEFKIYQYKVLGGKQRLDAVRICRDLNADKRLDKEKDVCLRLMKFQAGSELFTTKGEKSKLLYISCNSSSIEVIKKEDLAGIQSQDPNRKNERIIGNLKYVKDLYSFKKELEENLQKLDELQKSENHDFTDSDFQSIRNILEAGLLNVSEKIAVLKKEYSTIDFSIQPKDAFFLVGRKGNCVILKNTWDGVRHVDEIRYDQWTGKQISIKVFSQGVPKTFFEIDESGKKSAYANYVCNKVGDLVSVEILEGDGTPNIKFFLNTLNNPFNVMVKGASGKWITWPTQLTWPIIKERLDALLSHEFYNIRPFR